MEGQYHKKKNGNLISKYQNNVVLTLTLFFFKDQTIQHKSSGLCAVVIKG